MPAVIHPIVPHVPEEILNISQSDLCYRVRRIIEEERLIEVGEKVLLGLSGGIDSSTLLHLLLEIKDTLLFGVGIAHVNHLLRGEESLRDEDFVRDLSGRLSLPCHVVRIDVREEARREGKSIQHAGRDARYDFFERTAKENHYQKIVIAHTLDDQVETFILRALKGTGMRGLSAIPLKRAHIVRPLLSTSRSEIEGYARAHSVPFVEDSSNDKVVYERNFIRKRILPEMERLNPAFREKILSLLNDLTAVNQFFDKKALEFMKKEEVCEDQGSSFGVDALRALDGETRFRVMAHTLGSIEPGFIPLREHMHLIDKVLAGQRPNLTVRLPHCLTIKKIYGRFTITKRVSGPVPLEVLPVVEGENRLDPFNLSLRVTPLPVGESVFAPDQNTAFLDADKLGVLRVRNFREGDRFVPLGMKTSVKLKDFFISRKIPKEERRSIPLLLSDNDIVWVIGHRIDERYKATPETANKVRISSE